MRSFSSELIFYPFGKEYWHIFTFYNVSFTVFASKGHNLYFNRKRITPIAHTSEEKEYPNPLIA